MKNETFEIIEDIKKDLKKIQKAVNKKRNRKDYFFDAYALTLNHLDLGAEAIQERLKAATEGPHEKVTPRAENITRKKSS